MMSKSTMILLAGLLAATQASGADGAKTEKRCGWFDNPSPNNASLIDRDGEWEISTQGDFAAKGKWPTFKKRQWVLSGNARYGYGCACLTAVTDSKNQRILEIKASKVQELSVCRKDTSLEQKDESVK